MKLPTDYTKLDWRKGETRAVREQYVLEQEGKCYWCKEPLDGAPPHEITVKWINRDMFPTGFFKNPVHLQHCHKTDMTEGAVHAVCNAVMWQYHGR
jgi:hypothetical protein